MRAHASLGLSMLTLRSQRTTRGWRGRGCRTCTGDAPEDLTIGEYRRKALGDLQKAMRGLFTDPGLSLQDFGGIRAGSFRFSKGGVSDFHHKNLSGGEKASFDILLDVFVKRDEAGEAVFCIDEPELHVATDLQGPLIASAALSSCSCVSPFRPSRAATLRSYSPRSLSARALACDSKRLHAASNCAASFSRRASSSGSD